jgi:hypothetical protein
MPALEVLANVKDWEKGKEVCNDVSTIYTAFLP